MINDLTGIEIVEEGRRKFLQAHLGRFVSAISRRPGVINSEFYSQVFAWGAQLIEDECQRSDLKVEKADWMDSESLKDEDMNCSTLGGCTK